MSQTNWWASPLLTDTQKRQVSEICRRHKIGMVDFKENGTVRIFGFNPVMRPAASAFPHFSILDHGSYPVLEDRVDDMREYYWVDLLPDLELGA